MEKPSPEAARVACARGDLWSTFVLVGAAQALVGLGWQAAPLISERLAEIPWGTTLEQEAAALVGTYARIPRLDFSRGILEQQPSLLTASQLPASIVWSDWGTLDRVVTSLRAAGLTPAWMRELDRGARVAARPIPDQGPREPARRDDDQGRRQPRPGRSGRRSPVTSEGSRSSSAGAE